MVNGFSMSGTPSRSRNSATRPVVFHRLDDGPAMQPQGIA
jgi:hypothetical protein